MALVLRELRLFSRVLGRPAAGMPGARVYCLWDLALRELRLFSRVLGRLAAATPAATPGA